MIRLILAGIAGPHRRALTAAAKDAGHVALACEPDEVVGLLRLDARYAVVVDPSAGDGAGQAAAEAARAAHPRVPLIGLTGAGTAEQRAAWLDVLDRCLPLQEDPRIVLAEVGALCRRSRAASANLVVVGAVTLDVDAGVVTVAGAPAGLTPSEFNLLHLLMSAAGTIVTKETIYAEFYGARGTSLKLVDVVICKIRKKLTAAGASPGFVQTVWGRGYAIDEAAASAPKAAA